MKLNDLAIIGVTAATIASCAPAKGDYASYELYPVRSGSLTEMVYTPEATTFTLWAPSADEVKVLIYDNGDGGVVCETVDMTAAKEGTWTASVQKDLMGKFYTFNVRIGEKWQGETPGINALAVGVNGMRAAIIDMDATDPEGWDEDVRPALNDPSEVILYEVHHRDFSIHPTSGIVNKGKFLAMTEQGTKNPAGAATGIDHLKELGVTHVHLLPSYDYASVDESKLEENKYNWGYDPVNYNVPDGSYSTDPYDPSVRIREFKQMVHALHKAGIRVVLDVVYNHTFNTESSNFERTVPGYFYRQRPDGSYADASACGNETASDRPMMRKYMVESVKHWIREYHLDGFRFDLMGIHDIETMNAIRQAATEIDPTIFIYGEGWAASAPQLSNEELAMKVNTHAMPGVAAFCDEMRDGLRGPFNDNKQGAFLAGVPGFEESVKFGIAGAVQHPQVLIDSVNYTQAFWAAQPTQMISYVSCHDDMCLVDRFQASVPGADAAEMARLDMLAQTAVFTSQGVPFIYAGEEVMRDKKGVHNSYQSPDSINAIDWNRKSLNATVFDYYKGLIQLRKDHPAFHLGDADLVRKHLEFLPVAGSNVVAYRLKDYAGNDLWKSIVVVLNARKEAVLVGVPPAAYVVVAENGIINQRGLRSLHGDDVSVPAQSALIMFEL
ncbi:MAG: type I pullulanase [Bacteroides sp.]|nr:type I pullulanase [Bacteroides sp.]